MNQSLAHCGCVEREWMVFILRRASKMHGLLNKCHRADHWSIDRRWRASQNMTIDFSWPGLSVAFWVKQSSDGPTESTDSTRKKLDNTTPSAPCFRRWTNFAQTAPYQNTALSAVGCRLRRCRLFAAYFLHRFFFVWQSRLRLAIWFRCGSSTTGRIV